MSQYQTALTNLSTTIADLPPFPERESICAFLPRLTVGSWISTEYQLDHRVTEAQTTHLYDDIAPYLDRVAEAIEDVRAAAWAEYGSEFI
jgi:hypothetical protein